MPPDSLTPVTHTAGQDTAASLLWSRYRDAAAPAPQIWNDVIATLLGHRSIRSFLPTPLRPGTLDLLVAAAQSAATSSNLQAWSVVAVEDPARRSRLSKLAGSQKHVVDAPLFLVWVADLARLADIATSEGVEIEGIHYLELLLVGIIDAALAAQNAVVALSARRARSASQTRNSGASATCFCDPASFDSRLRRVGSSTATTLHA